MRLTAFPKQILAARRENRDMERRGYRRIGEGERLTVPYGHIIIDSVTARRQSAIYLKFQKTVSL